MNKKYHVVRRLTAVDFPSDLWPFDSHMISAHAYSVATVNKKSEVRAKITAIKASIFKKYGFNCEKHLVNTVGIAYCNIYV